MKCETYQLLRFWSLLECGAQMLRVVLWLTCGCTCLLPNTYMSEWIAYQSEDMGKQRETRTGSKREKSGKYRKRDRPTKAGSIPNQPLLQREMPFNGSQPDLSHHFSDETRKRLDKPMKYIMKIAAEKEGALSLANGMTQENFMQGNSETVRWYRKPTP